MTKEENGVNIRLRRPRARLSEVRRHVREAVSTGKPNESDISKLIIGILDILGTRIVECL